MKQEKEKNIYDVAKPFYVLLNFFGLACFKFDEKNRILKTTALNFCIFAVFLVSWLWMNVFRFSRKTIFEIGVKSKLLDDLCGGLYKIQHLFGILVHIYNFAQRKSVETLFKSIENFDHTCRSLQWNFKPRSTFCHVMIAIFILLLTIVILHCVELLLKMSRFTVPQLLIYTFVMMFYVVVIQQFAISINFVGVRLTVIARNFE